MENLSLEKHGFSSQVWSMDNRAPAGRLSEMKLYLAVNSKRQ